MPNEAPVFEITPDLLLRAYSCGIFPMAEAADSDTLYWLEPEERGILPLNNFHLSRSLKKQMRKGHYHITCDTCFSEVLTKCSETTLNRPDTWMNADIHRLYNQLFDMGYAHSVEVWMDDTLAGGLYGVHIGSAFFGESMFHVKTNASKIALAHLVATLNHSGFILLDTQFVTDHLSSFGTIEIPKADYAQLLANAIKHHSEFQLVDEGFGTFESILQLMTQTS